MVGHDDHDPPLRGARGRDVRAGEGRRLPAPLDRRGGHDRRQRAGAAGAGLSRLDLPLARRRAGARHAPRAGDGRAVRASRRLLRRPRRLDAHVRRRSALHGGLRDRRRQPADRGRDRPRERLHRHRRHNPVHVRRRGVQPGHVRRNPEPRGAVAAAGRVHGDQQPVRHGHLARAPLGRDRPSAQGRVARRPRDALRRDGRARHACGRLRGVAPRTRRPQAGARRGRHLPLPRPFDGRPGGVPQQGGGRAVARARPDSRVRRAARARGDPQWAGARADRPRGDRTRRCGGGVRGGLALPRA